MKLSRRDMMLASLGLWLSGCASTGSSSSTVGYQARRPQTPWPDAITRPTPQVARPAPVLPVATPPPPVRPAPRPAPAPAALRFDAIDRARWAKAAPVGSKLNPMNGVNRITVHHEGWTPVHFTDWATTAARLDHIRGSHVGDRKWADIGYHYIIDRAGRVWEGRNARYQGAHVSQNNEHNLGVMLLGNFDRQRPSDAQLDALRRTLATLMTTYRVPVRRVFTHQELKPTACPGRQLQPRIVSLRSSGVLA